MGISCACLGQVFIHFKRFQKGNWPVTGKKRVGEGRGGSGAEAGVEVDGGVREGRQEQRLMSSGSNPGALLGEG